METGNITPSGTWYQQTGSGMAETLQVANQKLGYTLADRATYIFQQKNLSFAGTLVQGDKKLLNLYHVMEGNLRSTPESIVQELKRLLILSYLL
ncbi:MAG: hypothetical protein ACYTXI_26550 [Nostoc sp.]